MGIRAAGRRAAGRADHGLSAAGHDRLLRAAPHPRAAPPGRPAVRRRRGRGAADRARTGALPFRPPHSSCGPGDRSARREPIHALAGGRAGPLLPAAISVSDILRPRGRERGFLSACLRRRPGRGRPLRDAAAGADGAGAAVARPADRAGPLRAGARAARFAAAALSLRLAPARGGGVGRRGSIVADIGCRRRSGLVDQRQRRSSASALPSAGRGTARRPRLAHQAAPPPPDPVGAAAPSPRGSVSRRIAPASSPARTACRANDKHVQRLSPARARAGRDALPDLLYPEGIPNFEPRDDIRITDRAPILRAATDTPGAVELVQRRWSWPGPGGKPVYNFRSEGRDFAAGPLRDPRRRLLRVHRRTATPSRSASTNGCSR